MPLTGGVGRGVMRGVGRGVGGYTASATKFDGTNDYLSRGSDFDSNADGQEWLISFWAKASGDGTDGRFWIGTGPTPLLYRHNGGHIQFTLRNTSFSVILNHTSMSSVEVADGWRHVLLTGNLATPESHIWVDDADDGNTPSTLIADTADFTRGNQHICGSDIIFPGCIAEFYLNLAESFDPSVEANRRKFITAAGKPASLGADGSIPTGSQPIGYWNNPFESFEVNKGYGGDMTVVGALEACADGPSV